MAKRKRALKSLKRISSNSLYKETENNLKEVKTKIKKLEKGMDLNRGTYNPKTKRFERKNTYTIITSSGKKVRIKPKNRVSYKANSWASKKLNEKLDSLGVNLKDLDIKKLSKTQMKALNKAFDNFIESQTSTIKGILQVEESTKDSIRNLVSDIDSVTNEDVETLYTFFNDKDYNYITQYIDPSELFIMLMETKDNGGSSDDFLRNIENYLYSDSLYKDEDLVQALENIYNKFI